MTTIIETERLILRHFQAEDLPAYFEQIGSDPEVMRYLVGDALSLEEFSTWIPRFEGQWAQHGFGTLAAILRAENRLVGHAGLKILPDTDWVEVLYAFGKNYWGQGLASEAAFACLKWGFDNHPFEQICAVAYPENMGSRRVMEKNGMVYQGIQPHYGGTPLAFYSISRQDFLRLNED